MITIYRTSTCVYCKMVEKLYDMKGIKYKEVVLDNEPELRQEVINRSGAMTVPITVKGDWEAFVIGWQPAKLLALA